MFSKAFSKVECVVQGGLTPATTGDRGRCWRVDLARLQGDDGRHQQ